MCDGDQLNVVVDPLFVNIAERNVQKYNIIPLFYDANGCDPELINPENQFNGLKRAHDYSSGGITSIGEISNMLTRLWNKDNPDLLAAAWLTMFNNLTIDAAKSGQLNHYNNYPQVARRISKAIGGKNGKLPYFFQFTKNGRKDPHPGKKRRSYMQPNNSTMNRICAAFNDIGNINMNYAGIPPFNYEMLLKAPVRKLNKEIASLFCEMDSINTTSIIEAQESDYAIEKEAKAGYEMLAEMIEEEMVERFGPLEETYPHIVKFLFTGENKDKAQHKQMFWRVYGKIALDNLKWNLGSYRICNECEMKIPTWVRKHYCKAENGFFECIVCGAICERKSSKQCRCEKHQNDYKLDQDRKRSAEYYQKRKELRLELAKRRESNLKKLGGD